MASRADNDRYGPHPRARADAHVAWTHAGEAEQPGDVALDDAINALYDPALGDGMSVNLGAALDEVWNATGDAGLSENQRHHIVAEVRRRVLRG